MSARQQRLTLAIRNEFLNSKTGRALYGDEE